MIILKHKRKEVYLNMLVKKYKCVTNKRINSRGCFAAFYGSEGLEFCPNCGKTGTLQIEERDWDVELSMLDQKEKEEKKIFISYCPSCVVWMETTDGKCPHCDAETIKASEMTKGGEFTKLGEKEYQKMREEKGSEGVLRFWHTLHAVTIPKELHSTPEEYDTP